MKLYYTPQKGDIIRLCFDPQSGHEQAGWRPGLVISNKTFNAATGFAVVCPITTSNRSYPFHLLIPEYYKTRGVIMVDQAKSLDYIARKARKIEIISKELLHKVMALHEAIFQDDGES